MQKKMAYFESSVKQRQPVLQGDAWTNKNLNSCLKGLLNKKHHTKLVNSSRSRRNRGRELPRPPKAETLACEAQSLLQCPLGPKDSSTSMRLGCAVEGPVFLSLHRSLTMNLTHLLVLLLTAGELDSTKCALTSDIWLNFHFYTNCLGYSLRIKVFLAFSIFYQFSFTRVLSIRLTHCLSKYN